MGGFIGLRLLAAHPERVVKLAVAGVGESYLRDDITSPQARAALADKFLDAITAEGSEPSFIHCASGNRASAMWMIKRLVVDHWDVDRASKEAAALGLTSGALKQFAIDYAQTHKR